MSERPIVLDNVVLSNFLLAGDDAGLVRVLRGRGCVTSEVFDENMARRARRPALSRLDGLIVEHLNETSLSRAERQTYQELVVSLGRGESSCIAVALHRGGVFASDDRVARRVAANRGVLLTGTIGLLIAGVRDHVWSLESSNVLLAAMRDAGFHAPVERLDGFVG